MQAGFILTSRAFVISGQARISQRNAKNISLFSKVIGKLALLIQCRNHHGFQIVQSWQVLITKTFAADELLQRRNALNCGWCACRWQYWFWALLTFFIQFIADKALQLKNDASSVNDSGTSASSSAPTKSNYEGLRFKPSFSRPILSRMLKK